jgi:type IX secretion system PorP/SprF family membrane protein
VYLLKEKASEKMVFTKIVKRYMIYKYAAVNANMSNNRIKINFLHVGLRIILLLFMNFLLLSLSAQISPLYQEHFNYEQFINPAITGNNKMAIVNLSHKQFFYGIEGSPYSTCMATSMRLGSFDFYNPQKMINTTDFFSRGRVGLGALMMQEKDGPLNSYYAQFNYAYFLPIKHANSELSFGLSIQFINYYLNKDILKPVDSDDPKILNANKNSMIPESGCGVYYRDPQFYIGVSVNDLLLSKRPLNESNIFKNKRDYFFMTGYKFFLKRFELEPSLYLAQIDENPFYYFSQLKLWYLNNNWFSIGYRSEKSIIFSLGIGLQRFSVSYAFERNVSDLGSYFNNSHEIMIGMNIGYYEPVLKKRTGKR